MATVIAKKIYVDSDSGTSSKISLDATTKEVKISEKGVEAAPLGATRTERRFWFQRAKDVRIYSE
jgi:hypothetical protein